MSTNTNTNKKRKWFILFRLMGIIVFVVLLVKIDIQEVWSNLKKLEIIWFLLALLLQLIMLFLKGLRWNLLKGRDHLVNGFFFTLGTFLESYAMGVITPGRLGEVMKAGYEKNKNDTWYSIFKIVAERGFDVGIFVLIAGLSLNMYRMLPIHKGFILLIILIGFTGVLFSFLLITTEDFNRWINAIVFRIHKGHKNEITTKFNLTFIETSKVFILSVLSNTLTFVSCYFLAIGIGLDSSFLYTSGGIAVAGLLNLLPITVMGLGTRELSFLSLFHQYDPSLVMAFSFLVFLTLQIGGGLLALTFGQLFIFVGKKKSLVN